jgi:ABC-2 type transport system permease protein
MKALVFNFPKKYFTVIKNDVQRQLTLRINIFSYRIGNLFELTVQIIIWSVIFKNVEVVKNYTYEEMISYIIIGWLIVYLTGNYGLENTVEENIFEGKISEFLIKPISYLKYIFFSSLGRGSIALVSAVFMQTIIIFLFRDAIVFNLTLAGMIILFAIIAATFVLKVFISIALGMVAFWTDRIIGIDYSFNIISKFFSGSYFTLSLLPPYALTVCKILPFAYTFYFPTQLFLGKINAVQGAMALGIEILWIFILYVIIKLMWKKGLKKYESVGI